MHFLRITPEFWEFDDVILHQNSKKGGFMLVYNLLKMAPDGGEFANTTLGLLFGFMEVGLAMWFMAEIIINW